MRIPLALAAAGAAAICAAPALAAPSVKIRGAVARVIVVAEARPDVRVTILRPSSALPLRVRRSGSTVLIDGDVGRRIRGCRTRDGAFSVDVRDLGEVDDAAAPRVLIRAPLDVRIAVDGAVSGAIGRSQGLDFANQGCGVWTIANVAGPAHVSQSGSGAIHLGSVGDGNFSVEGSGRLTARRVRDGLSALSTGDGVIETDRVDGRLDARVAGLGRITAGAGAVSEFSAQVAGSGGVVFGGEAQSLNAQVAGAGIVRVARVSGAVRQRVFGAGKVSVGPPATPKAAEPNAALGDR